MKTVEYIRWMCNSKHLWGLEVRIGTPKECFKKKNKLCLVECGGFPDQEWRDKNRSDSVRV